MKTINEQNLAWAYKMAILESIQESNIENKSVVMKYVQEIDFGVALRPTGVQTGYHPEADLGVSGNVGTTGAGLSANLMGHSASVSASPLWIALVVAAFYAYKRFFSQAARACSGRSGIDKTVCMRKFKIAGCQAAIKMLEQGKSKCRGTKDPQKCIIKIDNKIARWQKRIERLQSKIPS